MSEHVNEERREFSFEADRGYVVNGRVVACSCGRRLLVYAESLKPRELPTASAFCLECVDLTDEFRHDLPRVAAAIDRWVGEP